MAYVDIPYKDFSFEENPGFITWLQLYLLKYLQEIKEPPAWTTSLAEEMELNARIDIYKYFFDEELLDEPGKEEWATGFTGAALSKLENMSLQDFGNYIGEDIHPEVDFNRIKRILRNVQRMLQGREPLPTREDQ